MIKRIVNFASKYIKCLSNQQHLSSVSIMVSHHTVNGYEEFTKFVQNINKSEPYFFLYTGSIEASGKSWCPDCVEADPVIEGALAKIPKGSHFVTVFVGNREVWKDRNCPFRKDPNTMLMVIPTLVRWKGPQKLEGDKCAKKELVEMLFTDVDD